MTDRLDHAARVDAWVDRAAKNASAEQALQLFEQACAAVWRRAHPALGDVTLAAIADRALAASAEPFPFLSALQVEITGFRFEPLREHAARLPADQLLQAVRFTMSELIGVIDTLTAGVLTDALCAELQG